MSIPASSNNSVGSSSSGSIEISNPLFLSSSDNPSTVLVSKIFDGTGFSMWKRSMILALSAKNKIGFIDGTVEKPNPDSSDFHNWNRVNSMVISWLLNSLSKDIAESVLFLQSAKEIWNEINQRYEQSNGALIFQIQKQLFSLSQGSEDFSTYFTKIKRIWDELKVIHEIPNCSCGSSTAINKFLEEQRLIQLLMGLNDSYRAIRGQILMMSPLPNISTVHSLLIHEERQREISASPNIVADSMAMNVNSQNSFQNPSYQSSKKYCTHCKKAGHIKSQCYRIIGFPTDFKFTKTRKVESAINNVNDHTQDNNQSISQDQYKQLLELLSKVNINDSTRVNSVLTDGAMDTSGPFIQE